MSVRLSISQEHSVSFFEEHLVPKFQEHSVLTHLYSVQIVSNKITMIWYLFVHILSYRNYNANNSNNDTDLNVFKEFTINSVVNISDHKLTNSEVNLLSRGLNFCPTPGEPDFGELRRDLDTFHTNLRRRAYFAEPEEDQGNFSIDLVSQDQWSQTQVNSFDHRKFRKKSNWSPVGPKALEAFILSNELALNKKSARKPREQNLNRSENEAKLRLKQNKSIIIKPADKGSAVVIMNTRDYIAEANRQLSDPTYYKKVDENLTESHKLLVDKVVEDMYEQQEISKKCYLYLLDGGLRTPLFYMLPKIHKNKIPPPGRPILSANDCPTEKISALVDHFLRPIVETTDSYIKDTTHFLNLIDEIHNLPAQCLLVTLDVSSLYTNIPNHEGIEAVKDFLNRNRSPGDLPSNESLTKLLELVLLKNNFEFNNEQYLQVGGTAMGTRVAPLLR